MTQVKRRHLKDQKAIQLDNPKFVLIFFVWISVFEAKIKRFWLFRIKGEKTFSWKKTVSYKFATLKQLWFAAVSSNFR